jgi:hypothetical protein
MSGFGDVIIEHDDGDPKAAAGEVLLDAPAPAQPEGLPEGVTLAGDHFEIALDWPVTLRFKKGETEREERFATIKARRIVGEDLRAMMTATREDGAMMLLERIMLDIPEHRRAQVIDRMDAADLGRCLELVAFLGPKSPKTGR